MKIKMLLIAMLVLVVSGCASTKPGMGSYADAGTTAIALSSGYSEMNPILAPIGDPVLTAVASIGLKQAFKAGLESQGVSPSCAHNSVETVGMAAAGWNTALMAGASTGIGLPVAAVAGVAYWHFSGGCSVSEPENGPYTGDYAQAIMYNGQPWKVESVGYYQDGDVFVSLSRGGSTYTKAWVPVDSLRGFNP